MVDLQGKQQRHRPSGAVCQALEPRRLLAAVAMVPADSAPPPPVTYYVSPTGNDANSGTSPGAPWQTVAKVDATTFNPGDHILFQRGGQWDEALDITDVGTAADPIVFGAYGDPSLPKPLLCGSNPLSDAGFTVYSGTTYLYTSSTALDWIYNDHTFTRNADDASTATTPAGEISFVESTANSFYFDAATNQLYLNLGVAITNQVLTATERDPEIYASDCSYVTIEDLATTETAHNNPAYEQGYGIYVFGGTNNSVIDCDAMLAGKHSIVDIDCANFLGENLVATGTAPDLGLGGASGFVTFDDQNTAQAGAPNPASSWINDTYIPTIGGTGGGAYEAFISHGDSGETANILIQNMQSPDGQGMDIQTTGPAETVEIIGGNFGGGPQLYFSTDNSSIDGLTVTGANGEIQIGGQGDVVQNCLFYNVAPDPYGGLDGAIIDEGVDNIIRFNTIENSTWPALCVQNADSNTAIYGNIIDYSFCAVWLAFNNSSGTLSEDDNVFSSTPSFAIGVSSAGYDVNYAQWQAMGYDLHSVTADPKFVDPADDDFELQSASPAIDLYQGTPDNSVLAADTDFNGNPRPVGAGYDAGAFEYGPVVPAPLSISATDSSMPIQLKLIAASSPQLSPLLGIWIDSATAGAANPTMAVPLNQISSLSVAAGGLQTQQLIIDFSGGSFTLAGGLTYSATTAVNATTLLIGSGKSDTVSLQPNQVNFDALPISLSNLADVGLDVNSGSATLAYAATTQPAQLPDLTVDDNASFTVAAAPAGTGIDAVSLAGLSLGPAAAAVVAAPADAADRTLLELGSLAIAGNASLDLQSNDMILYNGSAAAVEAWLASGYADGAWNGPGIHSTAAAADPARLHAIGYFANAAEDGSPLDSTFDGQPAVATDVLLKYTLVGDANLDGIINAADYALIDNGFNTSATGWRNGDFNYDNLVNGDDYSLIDNAFNSQASLDPAASPATSIASAIAAAAQSAIAASPAAAVFAAEGSIQSLALPGVLPSPTPAANFAFASASVSSVWDWLENSDTL